MPINFLIMANTIKVKNNQSVLKTFDLKGSYVNRLAKKGDKGLKDRNLIKIKKSRELRKKEPLFLFNDGDEEKSTKYLRKIIEKDSLFL